MRNVLARIERHVPFVRDCEREYMLGILRRARRVAMAPTRIDLINVRLLPIVYAAVGTRIDGGFFQKFSRRGIAQRLAGFLTARHRLPVARKISALQEQDAQVRSVDQNQR